MNRNNLVIFIIGLCLGWLSLTCCIFSNSVQIIVRDRIIRKTTEHKTNIQFTQDSLIQFLEDLNIKYPHIVLAQAQLETGNFTSGIFRENWNCFGMKEAKQRVTTAKGTRRGHAHYETWKESILDYGYYACRYLGNIKSESSYYAYLGKNYAEDSTYVQKLKIKAEQNKKYFND